MNRLILRGLNLPILVLLTTIAVALQSSLFSSWPLRYFQPDTVLWVTIWCALRRGFGEGGLIVLIIAEIAEIHSSVPQGVFLISYMALYLLLRAADKLFVLPTDLPLIKLTLAGAVLWHACVIAVLMSLVARKELWHEILAHTLPGAVMAAILGTWTYRGLEKFDLLTFKNANAENPDEFQIENLGL